MPLISSKHVPVPGFNRQLRSLGQQPLSHSHIRELQINTGKLCNQACNHCHVDAGPKRTEIMSWGVMEKIIDWCARNQIRSVDITGGAPELNPHYRQFLNALLALQIHVQSRCNLTVLFEPEQDDLAQWFADRKIHLTCSLPCYTADNTDSQRGKGVFAKSIKALQWLNRLGYGKKDGHRLDLVYNPGGAFLPPSQEDLEAEYRSRLWDDHGIVFSQLLCITNLPINRFKHFLEINKMLDGYYRLLVDNFNPATIDGLMCRHLLSVDWLGTVYDCDFNQMMDIPFSSRKGRKLWDLNKDSIFGEKIATGLHCYGCTAGSGSSCGGSLVV